jgi:hypothetical protein
MAEPPPTRDPGLQPERTGLAALRTAMAATIVGLLCLRAWFVTGDAPSLVASLSACGTAAAAFCYAFLRSRGAPPVTQEMPRIIRWSNLMMAATTTAVALAAIAHLTLGASR